MAPLVSTWRFERRVQCCVYVNSGFARFFVSVASSQVISIRWFHPLDPVGDNDRNFPEILSEKRDLLREKLRGVHRFHQQTIGFSPTTRKLKLVKWKANANPVSRKLKSGRLEPSCVIVFQSQCKHWEKISFIWEKCRAKQEIQSGIVLVREKKVPSFSRLINLSDCGPRKAAREHYLAPE